MPGYLRLNASQRMFRFLKVSPGDDATSPCMGGCRTLPDPPPTVAVCRGAPHVWTSSMHTNVYI